jgi:signal transduction histidine kinase/CHASE2 domain-containing sensor protein
VSPRRQLLFCLAASGLLALACLLPLGPLGVFELKTLDLRFRVRELWQGPQPPRHVRVLVADGRSLRGFGRWATIHDQYAIAVAELAGRGADVVGLEPFAPAGDSLAPEARAADERLTAAVLASGRTVLGVEPPGRGPTEDVDPQPLRLAPVEPDKAYPWRRTGTDPEPAVVLRARDRVHPPLVGAARRIGHVDLIPDPDGVLRSVPLLTRRGEALYPSLVLQVACLAEDIAPRDVRVRFGEAVELWRGGALVHRIPVDSAGCMLVNYHKRGSTGILPLARLVRAASGGGVPEDDSLLAGVDGRVVLIGTSARSLGRFHPTGLAASTADVEILAEAIETVLSGRPVRRLPGWAQFGLDWLFLLAGAVLMLRLSPWRGVLAGVGLMVLYFLVEKAAFLGGSLWLDFVRPMFALQAAVVGFPLFGSWMRARALLRETRHLRRFDDMILMTMTSGVLVADRDGRVVKFNPRAMALLGRDDEDLAGRTLEDLFAASPQALDLVHRAMALEVEAPSTDPLGELACELPLHALALYPRADVDTILNLSVAPADAVLLSSQHAPGRCYVLTFNDVTEQVRLAQEDERRARLAAIGEIAAKLGHEIRNSLGGLRLYVENVREEIDPSGAGGRAIDSAIEEIESLYRKIDELRNYARDPRLDLADCDPKQLVDEALAYSSRKLQEKRMRVTLDSQSGLPPLRADRRQLREAFQNLINNAVEASPVGGHLRIGIERLESANGFGPAGTTCIHFEDEGPGIPAEMGEQVFALFFTTKPDVGTGLGLPIVKKIVESHGGRVTFRSESGAGTRFTVALPPPRRGEATPA